MIDEKINPKEVMKFVRKLGNNSNGVSVEQIKEVFPRIYEGYLEHLCDEIMIYKVRPKTYAAFF